MYIYKSLVFCVNITLIILVGVWSGLPGPTGLKEKFTKIDNEKHIKEVEVVEGGYA